MLYLGTDMASVAKWLRQRIVIPPSRGFESRRSPFRLHIALTILNLLAQ